MSIIPGFQGLVSRFAPVPETTQGRPRGSARLAGALLLAGPALLLACAEGAPTGRGLVAVDDGTRPADLEIEVSEHDHDHDDAPGQVRSYFHDFGAVPQGDVVSHVFRLENTDPVPLTITRMTPSCGCTVPAISYRAADGNVVLGRPTAEPEILVLPPGAIADLQVRIDTGRIRQINARKLLSVRITTDSAVDPFLTLECSIVTQQSFRTENEKVNVGKIAESVGGRGNGRIIQYGDSGNRIAGLGIVTEGFTASVVEEEATGNAVWRVEVEALPPLAIGPINATVELLTVTPDGEPSRPYSVQVSGLVRPDLELRPERVILREFQSDGGATMSSKLISNVPGRRFILLSATVEGKVADRIAVEFAPVEPDSRGKSAHWTIEVSALPGIEEERFSGAIRLALDDPQIPELTLTYAGF